jgi:hypothetical protein
MAGITKEIPVQRKKDCQETRKRMRTHKKPRAKNQDANHITTDTIGADDAIQARATKTIPALINPIETRLGRGRADRSRHAIIILSAIAIQLA